MKQMGLDINIAAINANKISTYKHAKQSVLRSGAQQFPDEVGREAQAAQYFKGFENIGTNIENLRETLKNKLGLHIDPRTDSM